MLKALIYKFIPLTVVAIFFCVLAVPLHSVRADWSWTDQTSAGSKNWNYIASSADGKKLAATVNPGYIYTSTDSGTTWVQSTAAGSRNWISITSSSVGTKLAAAVNGGYIYTSTDSGTTWATSTAAGSRNWISITSSSDGTKLAAIVSPGYIYTSTDSGTTWATSTAAGSRNWGGITSSADGTKLAAGASPGYIYTSTDSGTTWATSTAAGSKNWGSMTSSSDGTRLAVSIYFGYIYTSVDSGANWIQSTSAGSRSWLSVTSSSDGTELAAAMNGNIYTSTDSGTTWNALTPPGAGNWYSVAYSSDGSKLAAVIYGGDIWTGISYAYGLVSADFFLKSIANSFSGGNSTYSLSTSTSFKLFGIGAEAGNGTSTSSSYGVLGGFMRNVYHVPAPIYEQIHYHWRNDDNNEASATSATSGNQDTALSTISVGSIKRLRVEIANHGGTVLGYVPQNFGLQYGILSSTCSAISSWKNVGSSTATGVDWIIGNSSNLISGSSTTNITVSTGGVTDSNHTFLVSNGGVVNQNGTTTAAVSVSSDSFIDLEYALKPTATATTTAGYCFRTANNNSTTNFKYTVYPQTTSVAAVSLTFITNSSAETFPSLSPGSAVSTSSLLYVNTNNTSGYNLSVIRSNSTSTLMLSGSSVTGIPDKTAWSPGANCLSAGNASASSTQPQTLQFRIGQSGSDSGNYCSAWWGSNDTTSALYAGFPTTAQQIINRSTASSPTTTSQILYLVNVPATQNTGTYTGTLIYTAVANI